MKPPRYWLKQQTWIEGGFIAALLGFCVLLTLLQLHWTSQVSDATADRLRNGFDAQVQQLGRDFDAELGAACNALLPNGELLTDADREAVHVARLRHWLAGPHRLIFRRLAVAIPKDGALELRLLDPAAMKLIPTPWPAGWEKLRANLQRRAGGGGGQPFSDPIGVLREFPVFGQDGSGPGERGESEWMIFELDLAYVRQTWLPDLTRAFLRLDGEALSDLVVRTHANPPTAIYETTSHPPRAGERTVTTGINGQLWVWQEPGPNERDDWTLTAWQHPDALDRVVRAARQRNLALAVVLNALMLAGGLAIIRYTRRSRQLAEAQLRFVANVSHELRTPLTVIRGAGHNLGRGIVREPAQVAQYGQMIRQHADQLTGMIEQVLALAGARRRDAAPAASQPVALADVLAEAIRVTAAETGAARCRVQADLPPGLPSIRGDALALRRVFQNLLTNAAKHAAAGGWIGVSAEYGDGDRPPKVQVRVADHGPGIPAAEQARVFEPFFRGYGAQERQVRGSGLGLSLVREIVEAHRGRVSVSSDGRHGAVFTVELPVPEQSLPPTPSAN